VTVDFGTADGSATVGSDYAAASGRLTFLPGETAKRILTTPVDDGINEPAETLTVNLSNASGAVIADGQGVITIANRQTKFFVVDDLPIQDEDAQPFNDKTYKYETGGASIVANELYHSVFPQRGLGPQPNVLALGLVVVLVVLSGAFDDEGEDDDEDEGLVLRAEAFNELGEHRVDPLQEFLSFPDAVLTADAFCHERIEASGTFRGRTTCVIKGLRAGASLAFAVGFRNVQQYR
jgi:hypothetical protein